MEANSDKNKMTLFLEKNEIWFKTVLSFSMTIAAFFVSIASLNTAIYEEKLSSMEAEKENSEKLPFFSIDQFYDEERGQYIYGIINTGGDIRACRIFVEPIIAIRQYDGNDTLHSITPLDDNYSDHYKDIAYIYMPDFFAVENANSFENGLFAFSDVWIDKDISRLFPEVGLVTSENSYQPELANDYFRRLISVFNTDTNKIHMNAQLDYLVRIEYYNYYNLYVNDQLWLTRGTDLHDRTSLIKENQFLYHSDLRDFENLHKEMKKNKHIYSVDSLNLPIDEVIKETKTIFAELLGETYQISPDQNGYGLEKKK